MLTIRKVTSRFRQHKPINAEEALIACKIPLQFIDSGAFRHAFEVPGLPLVAKFCHVESQMPDETDADALSDAINHSAVEVTTVNRMMRRKKYYADLIPHLPKIYYADITTGTVLMHKYAPVPYKAAIRRQIDSLIYKLQDLCDPESEDECFDIHEMNVGTDESGKVILLDLGMLAGWQ